jgi:hypothetical protein
MRGKDLAVLPHLDVVDNHGAIEDVRGPCRVPLRDRLSEVMWRIYSNQWVSKQSTLSTKASRELTLCPIQPGLIALRLREPPRRRAHGDIHDQIEVLIDWRRVCAVDPWVLQRNEGGTVEDDLWEVASLEERAVEPHVEEGMQASVNGYPAA